MLKRKAAAAMISSVFNYCDGHSNSLGLNPYCLNSILENKTKPPNYVYLTSLNERWVAQTVKTEVSTSHTLFDCVWFNCKGAVSDTAKMANVQQLTLSFTNSWVMVQMMI